MEWCLEKATYRDRKVAEATGGGQVGEAILYNVYQKTFRNEGKCSINCGDGYVTAYICQNSSNCPLKHESILLYVKYISINLIFKRIK